MGFGSKDFVVWWCSHQEEDSDVIFFIWESIPAGLT